MASRLDEIRAPMLSRRFRLLIGAQVVSQLGDWGARIALTLLVWERTESAVLTAVATAVTLLPWVGIGQVTATLGDRFGNRVTMMWSDLARAAIFAVAAFVELPVGAFLVLTFVATCLDPPFEAARSSALVDSVPSDDYPDAIAFSAAVDQFTILVGYAVGGALVHAIGAETALGVNAATFLLSATLVSRLPTDVPKGGPAGLRLRAGIAHVVGDRVTLHAIGWVCVMCFFAMGTEAVVAPYAIDVAGLEESDVGFLAGMVAVSTILSSFVLHVRGNDLRLCRMTGWLGVAGGAAGLVAASLGTSVLATYLVFLFTGVTFTSVIPANAAAGRRIPSDIRSSAFSFIQAGLFGFQSAGAFAAGALADAIGIRETVVLCSAGAALAGVMCLVTVPRGFLRAELLGEGHGSDEAATGAEVGAGQAIGHR